MGSYSRDSCKKRFLLQTKGKELGRYPFYFRSTKFHNRLPDLTSQSPRLRLIARASDSCRPFIQINGEFVRDGSHVTLLLGQEIIHEPAIFNQSPLDVFGLRFQDLAERLAGGAVEAGAVGEGLDVAAVLGGHQAFAILGGEAGGEEGAVDGDVAFVVEVEEGEQGGGVGVVEDGQDGVVSVVADVDGDFAGGEPLVSLASGQQEQWY